MLLDGIFLPLTTPFRADGRLFERKLETNVAHYSRTPAAGMIVLSSAGEPGALSDDEAKAVLGTAIGAAAEDKVMIASTGRESLHRTLVLTEQAYALGYDVVAVRGPSFCNDERFSKESLNYFLMVADQSALPVALVSEPGRMLSVATTAGLAEHPNVLGLITTGLADEIGKIKAATVSVRRKCTVTTVFWAATRRMLKPAAATSGRSIGGVAVLDAVPALRTRTKQVGFQVLADSTRGMLEAWNAGASGAVPGLGACAPQACCEVWQAFRDGDMPLAEEKQDRLQAAAAYLRENASGRVAAVKFGCDLNGYYGGRPRLPLLPLQETEGEKMEQALVGMRN